MKVLFQVLMATRMKVVVFWDVAPRSLVDMDSINLMMEAVSSCETLVNIYETAWYNIPKDSHVQCYDFHMLYLATRGKILLYCSTWDTGMDLDILTVILGNKNYLLQQFYL
jgi:hypothetical protein